ncbi:hypothetical protein BX666DRAFT_1319475 [Dichotomocladium elegans]|nr:hypothetical protein BX666DRAFT_1319475 [Dichotomocladium elegans]
MDLSTMLNDDPVKVIPTKPKPQQPSTLDSPRIKERKAILQLTSTLQYLIAKDSKNNGPALTTQTKGNSLSPSKLCLGPSIVHKPSQWRPTLSLESVLKNQPVPVDRRTGRPCSKQVQLTTHEVVYRGTEPSFLLEEHYEIQGVDPRGIFFIFAQLQMGHSFVFLNPDHPWFDDIYGLRKTAYITLKSEAGDIYELHFKGARDKYLFGYLCKREDIIQAARSAMEAIVFNRKLPLVLDLDDTLVRLVGDGNDRYVPESDAHLYGNRVVPLSDGRRVVITERVHEFLDWAHNFFDISVCSLGDQNYVDNVVNVLDPQRTRIRGILYSARVEHDYIKRSYDTDRPPKNLMTLYPFYALDRHTLGWGSTLPLIIDDETRMWPNDQHDNIIVVRNQGNNNLWTVCLFPHVQEALGHIHQEFFRQLDTWMARMKESEQNGLVFSRPPPSAVGIYKTMLRSLFRDKIASRWT